MTGYSSSSKGYLPGQIDSAETFAESGVTLTHDKTEVSGGSVSLIDYDKLTNVDLDALNTDYGSIMSTEWGIRINPNQSLAGVDVRIGAYTDTGASGTAELQDSNQTTLDSVDISSLGVDDIVSLRASLDADTQYHVVAYNVRPGYQDPAAFPYTSSAIDVTSGVYNGNYDYDTRYGFWVDCTAVEDAIAGIVYVEWPMPDDVYAWGSAFFETVLETETVDVFVEEYDGANWVEIAGPITNTTEIPGDPSRNVRFRVEISRSDTANNPRLLQIHRQEVFTNA